MLEMVGNHTVMCFNLWMAWMQALESSNPDHLQQAAAEGKTKNRACDIQSSTLLLLSNQNCTVPYIQGHRVER